MLTKLEDGSYDFWLTDLACYAEAYISQYISQHGSSNTCAIFDIDETLLSSMPLLAMYGYDFSLQQQYDWFSEAICPLIKPIHQLYIYIENQNIHRHTYWINYTAATRRSLHKKSWRIEQQWRLWFYTIIRYIINPNGIRLLNLAIITDAGWPVRNFTNHYPSWNNLRTKYTY